MANKFRYWAFLTYPDSLPSDYLTLMRLSGLRFSISPLHDRDVNPDGTIKKAHYHNIVAYDGPTTFNAVSAAISFLNGSIPIPLQNPRGYYRYFCHLDNPDKAQYIESDIVSLNGFDISEYFSSGDISQIINQINDIVLDEGITEYWELICWCRTFRPDWSSIVCSHTLHFNSLCRSIRHTKLNNGGATTTPPQESLVPSDERT